LDEDDKGAEFSEFVRRDLRLAVDLSDGSPEDLDEDFRAGIMTTGTPPSLIT
jgi:hypothetical protein